MTDYLASLFEEWIRARRSVIHEFSGDLYGSHLELLAKAKDYARELGIDLANLEQYRDLRAYVLEREEDER